MGFGAGVAFSEKRPDAFVAEQVSTPAGLGPMLLEPSARGPPRLAARNRNQLGMNICHSSKVFGRMT